MITSNFLYTTNSVQISFWVGNTDIIAPIDACSNDIYNIDDMTKKWDSCGDHK